MSKEALLIEMLLRSGIAQYPDERLYNAAGLLTPDERPNVPVKMGETRKKETEGRFNTETREIEIPRGSKAYTESPKHLKRLAAVLAHEATHARQGEDQKESDAYGRQHQVLKRLGEKDRELLKRLKDTEDTWRRFGK